MSPQGNECQVKGRGNMWKPKRFLQVKSFSFLLFIFIFSLPHKRAQVVYKKPYPISSMVYFCAKERGNNANLNIRVSLSMDSEQTLAFKMILHGYIF